MTNAHPSQRGYFADELYNIMKDNDNIYLVTADLGYKMFDRHFVDIANRVMNVGAAEQTMMDIAVGLAISGKTAFTYTITPFYTRAFETIRNYINHEKLNVKMIGSGQGRDYLHDGISHWADDIESIIGCFGNIDYYHCTSKEDARRITQEVAQTTTPAFVCLGR